MNEFENFMNHQNELHQKWIDSTKQEQEFVTDLLKGLSINSDKKNQIIILTETSEFSNFIIYIIRKYISLTQPTT
jgi:hypothetical protein